MIDLSLADDNQVYVQPLVNELPDDVLGILTPRAHAGDLLGFGRACLPGDGLVAADAFPELLGAQAAGLHARAGDQEADARQRRRLGDARTAACCREGYQADIVLFEEDRIRPQLPTVEKDLPGGARRLVQKAEGIRATLVNGAVAFENGEATGARSGTVLKGRLAS